MRILLYTGVVALLLGLASLIIPIPHSETHGMNVGDMHLGMKTTHSERVSPIVSVVLIAGGIGMMVAGTREGSSAK